ncbi:DUF6751 family protein [Clostridium perfringens]|uniref:DUF6751 family protein n=1 Tax=Clostridium perfringens TaxID=1502 RepID=UPI0024BD1AB5|nr:DUF6751 family protein [Clostridium perfringens]
MDITLFNKVFDKETERETYLRTYISDCHFESELLSKPDSKGLISADKITCFIPHKIKADNNKAYIEPIYFNKLSLEEKKKFFTIKKGDVIANGKVDFNLSSYEEGNKLSDLKLLCEAGTIISVNNYNFGSLNLRHWEVGAT